MVFAIVVHRYGKEIVGGAERLSRELALRLAETDDVEVLTTCARDYRTWRNECHHGARLEEGVLVRRFETARERHWYRFGYYSSVLYRLQSFWPGCPLLKPLSRWWLVRQGPFAPTLIEHLRRYRDRFDALLFITCLYYPAVHGIPLMPEKSILVPTAHEEPAIQLPVYRRCLQLPAHLIFLSEQERELVHRVFHNEHIPWTVAGSGVSLAPTTLEQEDYFLYAGRIEKGKNVTELLEFSRRAGISLKLMGPSGMKLCGDFDYLGELDEQEKESYFSRCRAVIIPSAYESLSLSLLEAWAHGKPVIVNGRSPVLRNHVQRSGGGFHYATYPEFERAVRKVTREQGNAGRDYVKQYYSWDVVLPRYRRVLKMVGKRA